MNFFKNYILILYLNIALTQLVQYSEPLSKIHTTKINFTKIKEIINKEIDLECISTNNNEGICDRTPSDVCDGFYLDDTLLEVHFDCISIIS